MLKIVEWAVPLLVSVVLIQAVSDMLYLRAMEQQPSRLGKPAGEKQGLPVHVIDREATGTSIIT
ncbi:MAG TPA: hypothetical protein VGM96_08030 [Reyranella sp.]|jgi:hypothetical protein